MNTCPLCGPPNTDRTNQICDTCRDDPHHICRQTERSRAADYTRALIEARATHEANQRIANTVRGLLLPGVKRKTIRIEKLRNIVDMADAPRTLPAGHNGGHQA